MKKRNFIYFALMVLALGIFGFIFTVQVFDYWFSTEVALEKSREINPNEPVVVNFSEPMITADIDKKITLSPPAEVSFNWNNARKKLTITPKKYWEPEKKYQVEIKKARNFAFKKVEAALEFTSLSYPKLASFYPEKGARDVIVDIEDPLKAEFDKPLTDFKVKFAIAPLENLAYQLDIANKEIQFLPSKSFQRGKKYEIQVYIRHRLEEEIRSRKIYETYFETLAPPPDQWEKDFALRLEQAKKFTVPKITEGKHIDINLKSQVLSIFENGEILDAYLVSTGKRGMETSQGDFAVRNKFPRAWSKKYGLFMPYWMAMVGSGDFGIHELPEWPGGFKEGQNHLGIPVSHGCIRLGVGPAERVYNWAEIGTPVYIHY